MNESVDTARSPLERLSIERFGGRTTVNERVVSLGTTLSKLLDNNPNRLHWQVINESAVDVRLSVNPDVTSTSGWLLAASGGMIDSDYTEDGEVTGYGVYAVAVAAATNVRVREIVIL